MKIRGLLLIPLILWTTGTARAQMPPPPSPPAASGAAETKEAFSAERPGFTNGTETIPPHRFQLELGYLYSNGHGESTQRANDSAQLRYGLGENTEVRLGLAAYQWTHSAGDTVSGLSDLAVSGKWRFMEETPGHPSLALIAGTTLPTGSADVGEHFFQPSAALEASKDLSPSTTLQANVVYLNARSDAQRFDQWGGALNLGYHLTETTDTFIELYGLSRSGPDAPGALYTDGGFTVVLKNRMQLDASAGVALTNEARNDYFLSGGFSYRF